MTPPPPTSTLFPYTTLFRSLDEGRDRNDERELLRRALVVARHRDRRGLAVAGEHDLGGPVEQFGIGARQDRKSTRLNSSHSSISYAVFCLKKKKILHQAVAH